MVDFDVEQDQIFKNAFIEIYRLWVRDTLNAQEYIATKKYKKETFEVQITI